MAFDDALLFPLNNEASKKSYPDKILFGTDAFSFGPEVDRANAMKLARMVLHDNAYKLYGIK